MNTKNFSITLRAKDYDRYLATKFLPENCQENLAKWYLWWQSVTAQLKANEDPMPQIIRLQWWKEQLENSELTKENQEFYALKSLLLEKNISTKSIVAALDAEQNWLELPAHERSLEKMQLWLYGREELVFSISQQIYTEQEKFPANAQEQKKLAHLLNAYGLVHYVRSGMSFSLPVEWSQENWEISWLQCVELHWNEGKSMLTHPLLVHMALIPAYKKRLTKAIEANQPLACAPILRLFKILQQIHKIKK